jgi:hypothetical protein
MFVYEQALVLLVKCVCMFFTGQKIDIKVCVSLFIEKLCTTQLA